jgi:hypothetical protein
MHRLLSVALVCLSACAGPEVDRSTSDPGASSHEVVDSGEYASEVVPTWHVDVAPIFSRSCDGCHAPGGVGSPTWASVDDVVEWAPVIRAAVDARTMPPWKAKSECADYTDDFSLTDSEIEQIVRWADGGAPVGNVADAVELPPAWEPVVLERVDRTMRMAEPYTPSSDSGPDDYRCFLMEWPDDETVWVTGYQVLPDNAQVAHHIIPFLIEPGSADVYRALDAADESPGYRCYGGPGGDVDTLLETRWLGSWAPGVPATVLPEGTGIEVKPGSVVAFQVHYNLLNGGGQDQSGLALTVETERSDWAELQPLTDVGWVLGIGMEIPPDSSSVTHSWSSTTSGSFTMHNGAIHMHQLGRAGRLWVEHADGTEDCLLEVDDYDFDWQRPYQLAEPVQVDPGDTLHLSCTWDNPTDDTVQWGDGTGDEMCLGISLLTR